MVFGAKCGNHIDYGGHCRFVVTSWDLRHRHCCSHCAMSHGQQHNLSDHSGKFPGCGCREFRAGDGPSGRAMSLRGWRSTTQDWSAQHTRRYLELWEWMNSQWLRVEWLGSAGVQWPWPHAVREAWSSVFRFIAVNTAACARIRALVVYGREECRYSEAHQLRQADRVVDCRLDRSLLDLDIRDEDLLGDCALSPEGVHPSLQLRAVFQPGTPWLVQELCHRAVRAYGSCGDVVLGLRCAHGKDRSRSVANLFQQLLPNPPVIRPPKGDAVEVASSSHAFLPLSGGRCPFSERIACARG